MKLDFARNDEMKYCKDVEYDDGDGHGWFYQRRTRQLAHLVKEGTGIKRERYKRGKQKNKQEIIII